MKKFRLFGVILSAVMLASCSGNAPEQEVTETASESTVTTSETTVETTTEATTEETTETEAEEVPQAAEEKYVQVSPDTEFIDYEFIEDYQGTTDIGELADKAVEFLKESEYYAKSMENIAEFTDEEFSEYIRDGVIVPKFSIAYPNDYDGDGKTETFIVIKMPYSPPYLRDGIVAVRDFVIFSDKDDNMEIIDETSNMFPVQFLNYGKFKHIAIGGEGIAGVESHYILYGVKDGRFVRHYGDRCYFAKEDCFLSVFGWQGRRDFMYFDTAEQEYRVIVGVDVSVEDIRAMDTANVLDEVLAYDGNLLDIQLIGGKYYCIVQGYTDWGHVYTYDNGVFTLIEDSNVMTSPNLCELKAVVDIDIEQALANMKHPAETYVEESYDKYVQASPDTEFIDYEFIEDYQGTTDIGELADKAVEFLMTTEFYESSMKDISEFTDEKLAPYIEDGVIVPKFNTAYPNDYDGDGKTETFIEVDMPHCRTSIGELWRYYIFADSGGNMSVVHVSPVWLLYNNVTLLDYGRVKQIILGGDGSAGAESDSEIYGVQDGKCVSLYGGRHSYYKNDCFLYTTGWAGSGAFMYFDINEGKYFAAGGEDVPLEKIKEMDKDGVLSGFYDWYDENNFLIIELIGKKYYVFSKSPLEMEHGGIAYIYENGKFIQDEKCSYVRRSDWVERRIIDIEQALANMKPVQK